MPLCLSLPFTATGPAEMLTVPEVGLQGLYIGKNPQPPPTHHPTHPGAETHPQSVHGDLSQSRLLSAILCVCVLSACRQISVHRTLCESVYVCRWVCTQNSVRA